MVKWTHSNFNQYLDKDKKMFDETHVVRFLNNRRFSICTSVDSVRVMSHLVGAISRLGRLFDARPLGYRFILENDQISFWTLLRVQVDFWDDQVRAGPPVGGSDGGLKSVGLRVNVGVVFAVTLKFTLKFLFERSILWLLPLFYLKLQYLDN